MSRRPLYGAIEAGGTKFLCTVAYDPNEVLNEVRIATTTPTETLTSCLQFFSTAWSQWGPIDSFGIASFGPLDLNPNSRTWGCVLDTPKAGWSGADLVTPLSTRFARPVAIDTDVNAAALAEARLGAGRGCNSLTYVTVGTGIGGGAVINGQVLRGRSHPEMGHLLVRRDPKDSFDGICPFHGDCLEGLASGPAILARWGASLDRLSNDHAAHDIVANYLGQLAVAITLLLSSERVVFGGGIMQNEALLPLIRRSASQLLRNYPSAHKIEHIITAAQLGQRSGLVGAILLAEAIGTP